MENKPVQLDSVPHLSYLRRQEGFALLKFAVVIAILGILIASAVPAYQVYEQRAYALEASFVLRQILDSQSAHFRQHDRFYPGDGQSMSIFHGNRTFEGDLQALGDALGINIPGDDPFDYHVQAFPSSAGDFCVVIVSAPFPMFTDGTSQLIGLLNKYGGLLVSSEPIPSDGEKTNKAQEIGNNRIEVP